MKKIGLLVLALVLALGTIGVGYAKWTDTVTINGTVNTGNVKIGIVDMGVVDTGADPQCGVGVNSEGKDVAQTVSTNINPIKCSIGTQDYFASVQEDFIHVYPWYSSGFTVWLGNCGTVPVKVDNVAAYYVPVTGCANPQDLISWMSFGWKIVDENGVVVADHPLTDSTIFDLGAALDHYQIGGGQHLVVTVYVCFNEENAASETLPQNACASYNIVVTGSQWNEVP